MLNNVCLIGRMTKDIELRRTQQGDAVGSFTLAVNRNFTSTQEADFINCIAWKKQAENMERYTHKGSLISVEGRIQTRNYDNAQGQKVYVTEVVCNSVQFLEPKNKQSDATVKEEEYDPFAQFNSQQQNTSDFNVSDDIQF